ncbi:MAG: hypothetical protein R3F34_02625 [Planctomycetota bacterium]
MLVVDRYGVKPDGWRVVLDEGLGTCRYHEFANDPLQRKNLFETVVRAPLDAVPTAARERVVASVEELHAALREWSDTMPLDVEDVIRSARDLETEANQAERQRLAELGYVAGWDDYRGEELRARVLELRGESAPEGGGE